MPTRATFTRSSRWTTPPPLAPPCAPGREGPVTYVLHIFSGAARPLSVRTFAMLHGKPAYDIDKLIGGDEHDMLNPATLNNILRLIGTKRVSAALIGIPCNTYSVLLDGSTGPAPVRSREHPDGLPDLDADRKAALDVARQLLASCVTIALALFSVGGEFCFENPADVGIQGTPQYWREKAAHGNITLTALMRALIDITGASVTNLPQCALDAPWQKWTVLIASPRLHSLIKHLGSLRCTHYHTGHADVARGHDARGRSRSALSAAYTPKMAEALGKPLASVDLTDPRTLQFDATAHAAIAHEVTRAREVVHAAHAAVPEQHIIGTPLHDAQSTGRKNSAQSGVLRRRRGQRGQRQVTFNSHTRVNRFQLSEPPSAVTDALRDERIEPLNADRTDARVVVDERRAADAGRRHTSELTDGIQHGAAMHKHVRAAIEAVRSRPPRFASYRNLIAATEAELLTASMPTPHPRHVRPSIVTNTGMATRWHASAAARAMRSSGVGAAELDDVHSRTTNRWQRSKPGHGAPVGPIRIEQLFSTEAYQRVQTWLAEAADAFAELRAGGRPRGPADITVHQAALVPWARGIVWDTRNPEDCKPVQRSTRRTTFSGAKQVDRAAFRRLAHELRWDDADIVAQVGEGGIDARSQCSLDTVLSWHHAGLVNHFEQADAVITADIAEGWVEAPRPHLPFVPCRCIPRSVVMQERQRLTPEGELETYNKPRITTDLSAAVDSVNEGVHQLDRGTVLPTNRDLGNAAGVCDAALARDGLRAELYAIDLESAFRFLPLNRADWWTQCFHWIDEHGNCGIAVDTRMCFGGAYSPNRFERVIALAVAGIAARQHAFDALEPHGTGVQAWQASRAAAQARGELPMGSHQLLPSYRHGYIDDISGLSSNQRVRIDDGTLPPVSLGEAASSAAGGAASLRGTRVDAHLRAAVLLLTTLGFTIAHAKTQTGRIIVSLGMLVDLVSRRIACPEGKRHAMLAEMGDLRLQAAGGRPLKRQRVESLVGRLVNISQALPEIAPSLNVGYAVAHAPVAHVTLKDRLGEFISMLDVASHALSENEGVSLAPRRAFPHTSEPGSLCCVTDASGEDGVGGYAFHADAPRTVFIMAEPWPPEIVQAIAAAMQTASARSTAESTARCSMPAAELLGPTAMAAAVSMLVHTSAITAVTDCMPAANVINSATSTSPVMRALVGAGRLHATQWLGVHVHRELNHHADLLSHPDRVGDVRRIATQAGLRVVDVSVPPSLWQVFIAACKLPWNGWEWQSSA